MGLFLRVRGRPLRPRVFRFDDTVERIVFGTDPARAHVLFAKRVRGVGREHAALERVLGTYRWVLNGVDEVYVGGLAVLEGDALPAHGTIRLGARGPRLFFSHGENAEVPTLQPLTRVRAGLGRARALAERVRWNRLAVVTLALVLLVLGTGGAMALQRVRTLAAADAESRVRTALREAAPSVYRTVVRTGDGFEYPGGTAFVVAPGLLATNVHVAEVFDRMSPDERFLVRSSDDPPRTFTVTGVRLHPGYDAFELLWQHYGPRGTPDLRDDQEIASPGTACDVALLEVGPGARLGPALPLASDAALAALRPGDPVGQVGYPAERLLLGGSPTRRPAPHLQVGALTALSSFVGASARGAAPTLLQHSVLVAGGSSGSPLLDVRGRVIGIHHAGNYAFGFHGRIPLGVGVRYAQSAAFLRELLEGRAEARAEVHRARWEAELESLYVSGGEILREGERSVVLQAAPWHAAPHARGLRTDFVPVRTLAFDVPRASLRPEPTVQRVALPRPGPYVLLVWRYGARGDDPVARMVRADGSPGGVVIMAQPLAYGVRAYSVDAPEGVALELEVAPEAGAARLHVELLRASEPPAGAVPAIDGAVLEGWRRVLATVLGSRMRFLPVMEARHEVTPDLGDWSALLDVPGPGLYLVEAQLERGVLLDLRSGEDDDDVEPARSDPRRASAVHFVGVGRRLWVYVHALDAPDAPPPAFLLRVHRVVPRR